MLLFAPLAISLVAAGIAEAAVEPAEQWQGPFTEGVPPCPAEGQPVARNQFTSRTGGIRLNGHYIIYEASAGTIALKGHGKPEASVFYTAFTAKPIDSRPRPLTFLFNGGPGVASMWLRMGLGGPVKVDAPQPAHAMAKAFGPNFDSILDVTDLVYIDAVTTGLSRPLGSTPKEAFYGVDNDLKAFTRSIERFVKKFGRRDSPIFLVGESYGTLRAAGLAYSLQQRKLPVRGVVLVSSMLNYSNHGGTNQSVGVLPSYAAAAKHYGLVANSTAMADWLQLARTFAWGPYADALQGNGDWSTIADQFERFTSISAAQVLESSLQVRDNRFRKLLLKDRKAVIGKLDATYVGPDEHPDKPVVVGDPAEDAVKPSFERGNHAYLFDTLRYKTALRYCSRSPMDLFKDWPKQHIAPDGTAQDSANTSVDLDAAMRADRRIQVFVAAGIYDLATPFFGAERDLAELIADPETEPRIRLRYYESGHMMYTKPESARQLGKDLREFYQDALK